MSARFYATARAPAPIIGGGAPGPRAATRRLPDARNVIPSTVLEAGGFLAAAMILAVITMIVRRDLRRPLFAMVVVMLVGEVGLLLVSLLTRGAEGGRVALILREFMLFLIAIGFARIFAMTLFQGVLMRLNVPRILADLVMAIAMIVYLLVRISYDGVDLTAIAIPSAVVTGALAFSLQQTLGNLWGGISLQLDNTCRIGDWVRIDNVFGQIVSIRWRYMSVATNSGETVIVPNSQLVTNKVIVLGRRGDERIPTRRDVPFEVGFAHPPSRVIAIVEEAITRIDTDNVSQTPPPSCISVGFGERGIQYIVVYWIVDLLRDRSTDSRIRTHIYAALSRAGIKLAYPHRVLLRAAREDAEVVSKRERKARLDVLARVPLFAAFTDPERDALAGDVLARHYVNGDVISLQGEQADCLFILATGRVAVYGGDIRDERTKLAELAGPDYFGEMGLLTGQERTATVVAVGDVLCYRLDKDGFDAILKARPALVDDLSEVVARRQANNEKLLEMTAENRAREKTRAAELVRRIRAFFDLAA